MKGKRILITGGARGIGLAITRKVAAAGAVVGVNFLTSGRSAQDLRDQFGDQVVPLRADVRDADAVAAMVDQFQSHAGGIDVLVNNAGTADARLLVRQTASEVRMAVETNLLGSIYATQAALIHMIRQRGGLIVFHSSVVADRPRPGLAAYAAAKGGVESFARVVALEYRARGVRTVCLRLGPVQTDMYFRMPEQERRRVLRRMPGGNVPDAEQVATFVAGLVSDKDGLLNGGIVQLDAGYSLDAE